MWVKRCEEFEAYIQPLQDENTTLRGEREEWTAFVTELQADQDKRMLTYADVC